MCSVQRWGKEEGGESARKGLTLYVIIKKNKCDFYFTFNVGKLRPVLFGVPSVVEGASFLTDLLGNGF